MRVFSGRWFLASLAWVFMWMAMAGWAQAQPLPPASFAVDIAPGVRGRIDIGIPPPPVWQAAEPVYVHRPVVQHLHQQPIYLAVPPKHAKKWHKHCHRYGACSRPVVLVQQPERGWNPHNGGYWQTGHGKDYKPYKYYKKDKHRSKHLRDGDDDD